MEVGDDGCGGPREVQLVVVIPDRYQVGTSERWCVSGIDERFAGWDYCCAVLARMSRTLLWRYRGIFPFLYRIEILVFLRKKSEKKRKRVLRVVNRWRETDFLGPLEEEVASV